MKPSGTLIGVFFAAACNAPPQGRHGVQFGPTSAEPEIRELFRIRGSSANIDAIRQAAQARRIYYEALRVDHSMNECDLPRKNDLQFEQYSGAIDQSGTRSPLYIVIFDNRGRVLCIETRHAYRSL